MGVGGATGIDLGVIGTGTETGGGMGAGVIGVIGATSEGVVGA